MKQIKTVGKIYTYVFGTGYFEGFIQSQDRGLMKAMFDFVNGKQWSMAFGKYYPRRSTGPHSQNAHFYGHCQQIAEITGNDFDMVKLVIKLRAIKRGYPVERILNEDIPQSEVDCNTLEESYLIEECHQLAAEEEIILREF